MSAKIVIIDAREPFEYQQSHVKGAVNITPADFVSGQFKSKLKDVNKETPIIIYCVSGSRSNTSSMFLKDEGFVNVTNGINQNHVDKLISKAD